MTTEVIGQHRSRTRLPADQRRAQLLAQAARLFMERGYTGVGIDEIGAAVGISGPAVYRHVTGKEQLITEVAASWLELLLARTRTAYEATAHASTQERLTAMLSAAIEIASAHVAEVTVVGRYTDILLDPARPPAAPEAESAHRVLWCEVVSLWAPVLREAFPQLRPDQAGTYLRLTMGLILGAAGSEREISQAARVTLLVQATRRLLETPVDLPEAAAIECDPQPHWKRANRREQILDTAVRMFRERGYGGVSMADIADEVGVTASASYRHFTSKEELLATAVTRAGERMVLSMGTALSRAGCADDALDSLIRAFVCDAITNRDSMAVSVTERFHLSPSERTVSRKRERLLIEEWTHCLALTRPELNLQSRELLVHAVHRLVIEAARALPRGRHEEAGVVLVMLAHALLDPTPQVA